VLAALTPLRVDESDEEDTVEPLTPLTPLAPLAGGGVGGVVYTSVSVCESATDTSADIRRETMMNRFMLTLVCTVSDVSCVAGG